MPVPFIAIAMLLVFILQFIIRIWMLAAPKWERKCVRNPPVLTYGLPDAPAHGYHGDNNRVEAYSSAYTNEGYGGFMASRNYVRSGYSTPGFAGYGGGYGQYLQPSRQYVRQY